jgi:hypothetical protein
MLKSTLPTARPASYDMGPLMPPKYNQGHWGSCVSQAIRRALQFTGKEVGGDLDIPSSFFIYYNGRLLQGSAPTEDSGLSLRTGIKAVVAYGYCDETLWPYVDANFSKKPSPEAYADAARKKLAPLMYARVPQTLDALRDVLAANNPIVFGFTVFSSFDTVGRDGLVPYPTRTESTRGGHAMCIVGYDDATKLFKVHNSWGAGWGKSGYCYMTYDHIANPRLCSDFWTISDVPHAAQSAA